MSQKNIILVNYPLSQSYLNGLHGLMETEPSTLTLARLRSFGLVGMLKYLWQLRGSNVFIPAEDPDSGPVTNIMSIIATMIIFSNRFKVDENYNLTKISFIKGVVIGIKVTFMSLLCWFALFFTKLDIYRLKRAGKNRVKILPKSGYKKLMYLNCNLWFGVKSGGSVGHVAGVVNALAHRNINVTHYSCTKNNSIIDTVNDKRLNVPDVFGVPWDNNYYFYNLLVSSQLARDVENYDVIYQRLSLGNYSGVKEALRRNIPLVLEYNGSEVWVARNWGTPLRNERLALDAEELSLEVADLIVCISQPLKEELIGRGFPKDKIIVNPNGVDVTKFNPQRYSANEVKSKRLNLGIHPGAFVFGFIGTFGHWHGAEVLASAFAHLVSSDLENARKQKMHLLLIGDGVLKQEVEHRLRNIPQEFFSMTGIIPQEAAPLYLSCCDVFCSPHIPNIDGSKFFGSPTKLFEYMAMEKPILASNLDQVGEILLDGCNLADQKNAILVEPGDIDQLTEQMRNVISRPDLQLIARNALEIVKNKYTWEQHVKRILSALEDAN